jgi:CDP-diacylglycerol--glycerol-3-phosphate 3-phosphatidyltransferase/cardiolipin synthase
LLAAPLLWLLCQTDAPSRWAALAVLALAGLTDLIDGRIARALGQVSKLGATLDLIADRLLTLTLACGLVASGELRGASLVAAIVLVARDLVVASLKEAAPALATPVGNLEKLKIVHQFAGFGLLTAPPAFAPFPQYDLGRFALGVSAGVAVVTVAIYARRAVRILPLHRGEGQPTRERRQGGDV